jgi:hypothetical protein
MIPLVAYSNRVFKTGEVVTLARNLIGVPAPNGGIVPADKLGPGLVEQVTPDGTVCVRWIDADLEVCLPFEDVRSPGKDARLVTVKRYNRRGECSASRYKIEARLGLTHNWIVETRFPNIVRTLRDDGCAWTFRHNPIFNRIVAQWEDPRDEDDAEALTAAELTLSN